MMRRLLALAIALAPLAAAAELPRSVAEALARAGVPASAASAVVLGVEGGTPLVSHQAAGAVNPASVMKLVTSFAALELLGPAFTFHTDVLASGGIANGVLDGDLWIRGGGDPKLTYERLWQLAHQLRSKGLREIRGDVIVDRSYFAPSRHDPARFDSDPRRAYNAGPDAFLVNFHALTFRFAPEGDLVRVTVEPDLPNVEVASRIRLTKEPCGWWRGNLKQEIGGVLRGRVRAGTVPATARLIHRQESEPLANLLRDMNKYSNNVMARHIFLALSAERAPPGDTQASERIVREWLRARGIEAPGLAIENGAGLSRDDRVSAATMAAILRQGWSSAVMPELVASLPIFGTDGTLKTRRAALATGQAHLKGGTLAGVQSVAGYVLDRGGRRWIVVMIVNHANANAAQSALDALVEWVQQRDARGETRDAGGAR